MTVSSFVCTGCGTTVHVFGRRTHMVDRCLTCSCVVSVEPQYRERMWLALGERDPMPTALRDVPVTPMHWYENMAPIKDPGE